MNVNNLLVQLFESISQNNDIIEWSENTYGRRHHTLLGYDAEKMPRRHECPYIILSPNAKAISKDYPKLHLIDCICTVYHEMDRIKDLPASYIYQGVIENGNLRKMAETSIVEVANTFFEAEVAEIYVDYEFINKYPYHTSIMTLKLNQEYYHTKGGSDFYE